MSSARISRPRSCLASGVLLLVTLLAVVGVARVDAEETIHPTVLKVTTETFTFDLPADEAAAAFRRFCDTAGTELLYPSALVKGVRTAPVQGEFTPLVALERMLAQTDLVVVVEKRSGALVVKKAEPPNVPRASLPVVEVRPQSNRTEFASEQDELVELEAFEVTGSRLAFNSGEVPTQPVQIFTSDYIESMGVTSLGQLFQYIPAVTSYTSGIGAELISGTSFSNGTGQFQSRTNAQLRGGTQNETLLLVDGRRVPLTALRTVGGNGYDLGALPLAAIERVEVLLDGASAIYGADAVNGVINIILKKRYSGTELRLTYDNTFDKDAAIISPSLTHGFSTGKLSGLLTLSASENNILLLADRDLTSTFDRTVFGGTIDQSQPTLFVEGTGSLAVASGTLPGTDTQRVSIPVGYVGGPITIADYVAAPPPVGGITPGRLGAINYAKDRAAYLRLAYEFHEAFTLTGSVRASTREYRDNGSWRRVENVTIPVGYAGNPFGVPVRLSKTFYDLPPLVSGSETENIEVNLTASGDLPGDWRYETNLTFVQGISNMAPPILDGAGGQIGLNVASSALFTSRLNAEIAAGRNPILIYDSNTQSPNAPGALDTFFVSTNQTQLNDRVRTWTFNTQANGTVYTLPAGNIQAAIGFEARAERVAFPNSVGGQVWPVIPERDVTAFFAEVRVPLLGEAQNIPGIEKLDFNFAIRTEDYSDFGRSTTPRYGLAWRPIKSILLRGSYGEGFLAPQLYRTAEQSAPFNLPPFFINILFAGMVDTSRGDAPITGPLFQISGGNPDLKPQRSEQINFGAVIDVPGVKGLSLSLDYYDNKISDGFGTIANFMDRQLFAPETIIRGDKLPDDPADWLGPILGYDGRTINIASSRSAGYSFGLRYQRRTTWGDFSVNLTGERTTLREERILPNSALTPTVNERYVPQRITLNTTWGRGPWEAAVTAVHSGEFWNDSTRPTVAPSRNIESVTRWDISGAYDFGQREGFGEKGSAWWQRALHDTELRLSIINLFNTEPPLNVAGFTSSSIIDMRLRRYVIDITKRF
jgi:iron complex outermembrane recepter protein